MKNQTFLGLDLGTSGLRGLLTDRKGNPIVSAEANYDVEHAHSGWSEQNPNDWIAACNDVVAQLKMADPDAFESLAGIAVSGHMHGAVLIDKNNKIIRNCILWNDTRSHEEAEVLDTKDRVRELSGNIVFPGFTAPKLMWVAKHEPENFCRIHKVLLPAAYLNFWLTGFFVGDFSDAAGTSWLDVGKRDWSEHLLASGGVRHDQMPNLVEGSESAGKIRSELAKSWGVSDDVTIAGGAGDNAAAACGVGRLKEGEGFVSLGTSGVIMAAKENYKPMPSSAVHTFCHAIPNRWYQMGVILAATDCLNWLSGITGQRPADLTASLGDILCAPGPLYFLPYLSGERTPHNDSQIRGSFIGLDISTSTPDMTRAVLEGVAYALRDNHEALKSSGTDLKHVLALGGGARSRIWVEMIATVLNLPLALPKSGDFGAALGAARLAICATTKANPEDVMITPPIDEIISPNTNLITAFDKGYETYKTLYPAIKALT